MVPYSQAWAYLPPPRPHPGSALHCLGPSQAEGKRVTFSFRSKNSSYSLRGPSHFPSEPPTQKG